MKKTFALLALALASLGSAHAASPDLYAGASIGYSHVSNVSADDTSGVSGKVYAGAQLTPALGAEVSYSRYSDISAANAVAKPEMFAVEAVGRVPVYAKTAVFAKGGFGYTRVTGDEHAQRIVPVVGVGAEYALTKNVSARAELQYVHDFAGTDAHLVNTDVGLNYKF